MTDPYETGAPHREHPSAKQYIRIGMILFVLTALEVTTYLFQKQMGGWLIPTLWVLAVTKFSLVALWFMHLKFDDRRYSRFFTMGIAGACTLYIVVLLTFKTFLK
jgi:cytochrome c oxidase subunit 4